MVVVGFGVISMAATANTLIQLNVPDGLRGRVMSVYTTVFAGSTPVGGIATGAVAATLGAAIAMFLAGLLSAIVGFFGWLYVVRTPGLKQQANADAARYSPEGLAAAGGPAIQGAAAVADEEGSAVTSMPVVEALATLGPTGDGIAIGFGPGGEVATQQR